MVTNRFLFLSLTAGIIVSFALGLFLGLYFNNYFLKFSSAPAKDSITDVINTTRPDSAQLFILYNGTLKNITDDKITLEDKRTIPLDLSLDSPVEFRVQTGTRSSLLTQKSVFTPGSKVSIFIGANWLQNKFTNVSLTRN